jgi:glycosyltransferase involved in cell wall biosynthesis
LLSSSNIQVTGWLSPDKVAAIVAEGDVYLSTAKYEGLPFAVLEAMAMNMPMLLSNCTGNKDLINDLNGAVFTDEQEAVYRIMQFYNNASMLNVMGQHSGTYCRKYFNLRDTFRLYEKLYHQASALAALNYSI